MKIIPPAVLPRCIHGNALSDWGGTWLKPPCGCNFDNTSETNKNDMVILKLGLANPQEARDESNL